MVRRILLVILSRRNQTVDDAPLYDYPRPLRTLIQPQSRRYDRNRDQRPGNELRRCRSLPTLFLT